MPDVNQAGFIERYENTTYPFTDTSTFKDITGEFCVPKALFLDASLYPQGTKNNLYIYKIIVSVNNVEIIIGEENSTKTFHGNVTTSENNVRIKDDFGRVVGILCSDKSRISYLFSSNAGTYTFSPKALTFVSRCVFQDPGLGVSSIGSGISDLSGSVWLIGGEGVFLRNENNTVRIDVAGEVLHKLASCDTLENYETKNYLRTINNTPPDIYGNITIGQLHQPFNTALRVVQAGNDTSIKQV